MNRLLARIAVVLVLAVAAGPGLCAFACQVGIAPGCAEKSQSCCEKKRSCCAERASHFEAVAAQKHVPAFDAFIPVLLSPVVFQADVDMERTAPVVDFSKGRAPPGWSPSLHSNRAPPRLV